MSSLENAIREFQQQHAGEVAIVGHHYQQDNVIRHCGITGDSLELARKVAAIDAPHIVFCGVFFMAESAALLARAGQQVHLPAPDANCVMAQMTPATLVRTVLSRIAASGRKIVPLAYVNTPLAVKAVVGEFGGAVCTSANAKTMLRWALQAGDGVLFLPDANLGRNTATALGLTEHDWHMLNIRKGGDDLDAAALRSKQLLLWPGCCAIHAKIRPEHIAALRAAHPECRVAVHPECAPECVRAADAAGSTSFLINYVHTAPAGSVVGIGTEANLVHRLREQAAHCTVLSVRDVRCSDMGKTTEERLLACLRGIAAGQSHPVTVPEQQQAPAKASLERMLNVCARTGA